MPYGSTLDVFIKGIKPVWEDEFFTDGCQLEIKCQKQHTSKFWEDLLLAMLGEQFSTPNFVAGIEMKLKPQFDRISVWLRDSTQTAAVEATRKEMAAILQIVPENEIVLSVFKELKNQTFVPKKDWRRQKKNEGEVDEL